MPRTGSGGAALLGRDDLAEPEDLGQQGFCYRDDGEWRVALLGVLVGCGIGAGVTLAVHSSGTPQPATHSQVSAGVCQALVLAERAAGSRVPQGQPGRAPAPGHAAAAVSPPTVPHTANVGLRWGQLERLAR